MLANLSVDQVIMKARSHAKKGEIEEAQKLYQSILKNFSKNKRAQEGLSSLNNLKPNDVKQKPPQEVINQLVGLYNQGELSAVIEQAQVLTKQYPEAFTIWNILGAAAAQTGKLDEAIDAYKKAITIKPNSAEIYSNMGVALQDQGKFDEAIDAYQKAISLNPNYADAFCNMGNALKGQGKLEEAIDAYQKAISLNPNHALAHNNMGNALKDQGKFDEAIDAYKKAISLNPNYVDTYYNMGLGLKAQGKLDEAIDAYQKAISLNPNHALAHNNIGVVFQGKGQLDESIWSYKKCISLKPNNVEAHQNLSFALLNSGKIKEGLDENEWRWKTDEGLLDQRHFSKPLWDGKTSLKNKKILLWSEQGIGDTMNWSSCLPFVTSQAKHCVMECQEKLVPLLKRSFPKVEVKAVNKKSDLERDDFDLHLPMGSLYKHFIDKIMQNPKPDAFLVPDPERVNFWRERLNSLGEGPYIGISWKSSVVSAYRRQHYATISEWSPVLTIPDVTFINLQYTDYANDIAQVQDEFGVKVHNFEDLDQYNDIDDVAALCAALDMVVSTKVAPPFISSAVGTPTKIANWRQSSYNNILTNPVTSSYDMFDRDTWETWDNVFNLIADDIFKLKNKITDTID
jgi:tetratricopeptide (TPR) repeat protein